MMDTIDQTTGEVLPVMTKMPPGIAKAIVAVMKDVKRLGSDEKNEHGRYNYVSVDKFYERIGKLMADAGLALLIDETASEVKASDKSGNPWLFVKFSLSFMHESGEIGPALQRSCALPISGPQAFGAAQSYIEKQFLRQVFKVPTGDKDADDTAPQDHLPASRAASPTQRQASPQAAPAGNGAAASNGKVPPATASAASEELRGPFERVRRAIAEAPDEMAVDDAISGGNADMKLLEAKSKSHHDRLLEFAGKRRDMLRHEPPAGDEPSY